MSKSVCYHCGEDCLEDEAIYDEKSFCCSGCQVVYEILKDNDLCNYYNIENTPGISPPKDLNVKYEYLENTDIVEKLISFRDEKISVVSFFLPKIHCSSCIWLLENLFKLNKSINSSRVNFLKKEIQLTFNHHEISLRGLVELLSSLGYSPEINLDKAEGKRKKVEKSLIYKIGIAGFCFGNIMLISLPEYFGLDSIKESNFSNFFGYLSIALSFPVMFYSAKDYFISAFIGLKQKNINIDVPISLGVLALFLRSLYEIILSLGGGYMDSLSGLVFFLLLGKAFQQITYNTLSFERDYKSYFPIAVIRINDDKSEESISVVDVNVGDLLLIKNNEIIPVDAVLDKGTANIDNSFVTGESNASVKKSGEKIYAGGKQVGGIIYVRAAKKLSQSYLTQLWNNDAFTKHQENKFEGITNSISKYFTIIILLIAFGSGLYWFQKDFKIALNAFTAVLIIACPCALALSAPFTFGNVLRILGRDKFFLKSATVIEGIAKTDTIIFDKTGTITQSSDSNITYKGKGLDENQKNALYSLLRQSSHPLSKLVFNTFKTEKQVEVSEFNEIVGNGIKGIINGLLFKVGSYEFTKTELEQETNFATKVHINIDGNYIGYYQIENKYRKGLKSIIVKLRKWYSFNLVTGDNENEKENLTYYFNDQDKLYFNQSPKQKLDYVRKLQEGNKNVLMIGDGLNDSGALKQSNVGISVSEDVNTFSPACDAILDASSFEKLPTYIRFCRQSIRVVIFSFIISFLYNIVGLYFGVTGALSPVIAAILMPLSSITVVVFVTITTNILALQHKLR
ncbi:MAG: heavy metal translocating P-type ATPase metal-binding domain-containing protein [Flavobacteriales bacterium]|nr:heavy metal translocating P-type ATPase metal-binding domain-containing protein [Flavobacteriales bacterium]